MLSLKTSLHWDNFCYCPWGRLPWGGQTTGGQMLVSRQHHCTVLGPHQVSERSQLEVVFHVPWTVILPKIACLSNAGPYCPNRWEYMGPYTPTCLGDMGPYCPNRWVCTGFLSDKCRSRSLQIQHNLCAGSAFCSLILIFPQPLPPSCRHQTAPSSSSKWTLKNTQPLEILNWTILRI